MVTKKPIRASIFLILVVIQLKIAHASKTLNIATIDGSPWGFVSNDKKVTGMMYEISNRIAEVAGISYSNKLIPYPRIAVDLADGSADFVLQFPNKTILKDSVEVAKIITMPIIIVGPAGSKFNTLKELQNKVVGVIRTSSYVDEFDNDQQIKKHELPNYAVMAKMVKMKRLDAGIGSSVGFYYSAKAEGIKPQELGAPLVVGSNYFALLLSKKASDEKTVKSLKAAVKKLKDSGEIQQIVNKYMGEYQSLYKL